MSRDRSALLEIFDITEKAKLVAHARTAVICSDEFASLVLACKVGAIPFGHIPVFQHHHPEHLDLTEADLKALSANGVGPFSPTAQRAANKVFATFRERRLFNGHMIWPITHRGEWHLFYFDQRDIDQRRNHWKAGSHIHLINWITHPHIDPNVLLKQLRESPRPKLTGSLHVRYDRKAPDVTVGRRWPGSEG